MVSAAGETVVEPEVATEPTPLSIEIEVALAVSQESVKLWPFSMVVVLATKEIILAGGMTVTTVEVVVVPPSPVAVRV